MLKSRNLSIKHKTVEHFESRTVEIPGSRMIWTAKPRKKLAEVHVKMLQWKALKGKDRKACYMFSTIQRLEAFILNV